ncbi:YibE/F family protein [Patulibacter americanus]|uniref:YibE/F family protein n=1 Tax=Patulibacter americanus TaxID=588672 RepID=UPI0003B756BB|nr:YibE/F family protein [Patulibacter americanus]
MRAADRHALRTLLDGGPGRLLVGVVSLVGLLTVVGLIALWPQGDGPSIPGAGTRTVGATVVGVASASCGGPSDQRCLTATFRVTDGPDEGYRAKVVLGPPEVSPALEVGDKVRLVDQRPAEGTPGAAGASGAGGGGSAGQAGAAGDAGGADAPGAGAADSGPVYAFSGVDRRVPLVALAIIFALLGAVVARGRGLLALVGTAASLSLVVLWLVPAILDGSSPILVATVGALAVMFVTTALTYGVTTQSLAAVTGIGVSLLVAALLGTLWSELAGLDGKDGDLGSFALQSGGELPLQGILLAGMVIGALGVLTDTVVSQVSTVAALHRNNPSLPPRALYREAFIVGRDHLSATIHTLVLAYAGATLPLLLVASANGVSFGDAINDSQLAEPIVSTLVGSAALVLSVPLSTALAAALVGRLPEAALGDAHHHHHH